MSTFTTHQSFSLYTGKNVLQLQFNRFKFSAKTILIKKEKKKWMSKSPFVHIQYEYGCGELDISMQKWCNPYTIVSYLDVNIIISNNLRWFSFKLTYLLVREQGKSKEKHIQICRDWITFYFY